MNRRKGFGATLGGPGKRLAAVWGGVTGGLGRVATRLRLPLGRGGNRRRLLVRTGAKGPSAVVLPQALVVLAGRARTAVRAPRRSRWAHAQLFAAWAAPFVLAMVAFAVPLVGVRAYEYVASSEYFQVHTVLVDGGAHLSHDELVQLAGIVPGTRVLGADIDMMAARLRQNPWIRSATVDRQLPDTLVIAVTEHVPAAYVAVGQLWLVDTYGEPFLPAEATPASKAERLPILSLDSAMVPPLVDRASLEALRPMLGAALNMTQIWGEMKLARRFPIGEVHIDGPRGYTLVLEGDHPGDGTEVVLGRGPFRDKLFRLEYVLEALHAQGKSAEYVLLDDADTVGPTSAKHTTDRIGGARVVVKADLADDLTDALADAIPPGAAAARGAGPGAAHGGTAHPHSSHAAHEPNDPQTEQPADGAVPPFGADEPSDEPNEVVPLSGGRPAAIAPDEPAEDPSQGTTPGAPAPGGAEHIDEENQHGQEH